AKSLVAHKDQSTKIKGQDMYKLLLSWRYLRTRFLALASIVSVMLGVTTLIVVNSVMEGFATKLKSRIRGIQADVLIESHSMDGFGNLEGKMQVVRQLLGDKVAAMSPVIEGFAMLQFHVNRYGPLITRNVKVIGVDPMTKSEVGEFGQYLINSQNK